MKIEEERRKKEKNLDLMERMTGDEEIWWVVSSSPRSDCEVGRGRKGC